MNGTLQGRRSIVGLMALGAVLAGCATSNTEDAARTIAPPDQSPHRAERLAARRASGARAGQLAARAPLGDSQTDVVTTSAAAPSPRPSRKAVAAPATAPAFPASAMSKDGTQP